MLDLYFTNLENYRSLFVFTNNYLHDKLLCEKELKVKFMRFSVGYFLYISH